VYDSGHGDRRPVFPAHATQGREQVPHPARIRYAGFGMGDPENAGGVNAVAGNFHDVASR
jgi:hypothetical protein